MVHINIARRFLQSKPEIKSIRSIIEHTFCEKIIINPEFHNVNCRFCGAIHSVNWANISVLSQVIHNVNGRSCGAIHSVNWANISVLSQVIHSVNERKTVQTNMISFVSHGDKTLQRLIGMPSEQKHNISFIPFFFS